MNGEAVMNLVLLAESTFVCALFLLIPRITRRGHEAVVPALAVAAADRVNGGQVQHIESHRGDGGQARLAVAEGAMPPRLARQRAREQFVPCAEPGALPVHPHRQFPRVLGGETEIGILHHDAGEVLAFGDLEA